MTLAELAGFASEETRDLLQQLRGCYLQTIHAVDSTLLDVVLGTYFSRRLRAIPVWLMIVGAPSRGKSTTLRILNNLAGVVEVDDLSEASLISGSKRSERSEHSKGGLLYELGDEDNHEGFLLIPDFAAVTTKPWKQRHPLLSRLTQVYDGRMTRAIGHDGGYLAPWQGKVTMGTSIAYSEMRKLRWEDSCGMGERMLHVYLTADEESDIDAARAALRTQGTEDEKWMPAREIVEKLEVSTEGHRDITTLPVEADEVIVALALLCAKARTPIHRDGYTRAVHYSPQAEGPARLAQQLAAFLKGCIVSGQPIRDAFLRMRRVALDSIPEERRNVLGLLARDGKLSIGSLSERNSLGDRRASEIMNDLALLGLCELQPGRGRLPGQYSPTPLVSRGLSLLQYLHLSGTQKGGEPSAEAVTGLLKHDLDPESGHISDPASSLKHDEEHEPMRPHGFDTRLETMDPLEETDEEDLAPWEK
jgi:hypothetical protein